jgi:hypothetical protein
MSGSSMRWIKGKSGVPQGLEEFNKECGFAMILQLDVK